MTDEQLAQAKDRAMAHAMAGELDAAVQSMIGDMGKINPYLEAAGRMYASHADRAAVVRWIAGFR